MIGGLARAFDNLFGRGEAAVTVPPLDGALRPNRMLDEATSRFPLVGVDCLAVVSGELLRVRRRRRSIASTQTARGAAAAIYGAEIACLARDRRGRPGRRARRPARSLSRAAASTGAAIAPTAGAMHHRDGRDGHRTLRRERLGDQRPRRLAARPPRAQCFGQHLAHRPRKRDVQPRSPTVSPGRPGLRSMPKGWSSPRPGNTSSSGSIRPGRKGRRCCMPTCRPIPAGSRRLRTATGWRCSRRAASSSSSCCASRPTASA